MAVYVDLDLGLVLIQWTFYLKAAYQMDHASLMPNKPRLVDLQLMAMDQEAALAYF
jgi:hypothetical protein